MYEGQIALTKALSVFFCIKFLVLTNLLRIGAAQLKLAEVQSIHFRTSIAGTSLTFAFIKVQMAAHYYPFTGAVI